MIERGISVRNRVAILRIGKISISDKVGPILLPAYASSSIISMFYSEFSTTFQVKESLKWGIKGILLFVDSQTHLKNDCSESKRTISPVVLAGLLGKSGPRGKKFLKHFRTLSHLNLAFVRRHFDFRFHSMHSEL